MCNLCRIEGKMQLVGGEGNAGKQNHGGTYAYDKV